ncbi:hypothetical protein [Micromonospora maritima]|uniref:hypothetical protein n=1 Tax=Micromonospora maritima TaxID=986711 RepID=UPI00157CCF22|nr:hypothetical protein [Micromonospora maritima]
MNLKAYRIYGSYISVHVARALGLPAGHNQADIFVAATSKPEALQMLNDHHIPTSRHDKEFRLASGTDVATLIAGGVLTTPGVYACAHISYGPNRAVAAVNTDRTGRRLGRLRFVNGDRFFEPEPATVP